MVTGDREKAGDEISSRLSRIETMLIDRSELVGEFEFRQLFSVLWSGKWIVLLATMIFAVGSVVLALQLPDKYEATAVLVPESKSGSSSLSKLGNQFGGLAALAGINISGDSGADKTVEAMELMKSWDFQENLIKENHLEVEIFAANGWSRSDNRLLFDRDLYDQTAQKWVRKFNPSKGETVEPSGWELYKEFSKRFSVVQDKKTALVTVTVESYSPYLAKRLADLLVDTVNRRMQDKDRNEAKRNIDYLEAKMSQTSLSEMKSVFSRLIEEQTKTLMLADVSDEYVLKRLVPVKVPEQKTSPRRLLIVIVGAVLGFVLTCIFWLLFRGFKAV